MSTRLSRYCDGVMEAGWLLAVITVPLFFNVYSSRVFEPDKLALLRSIALVVGAAWLLKAADQVGGSTPGAVRPGLRAWLSFPLAAPVSALLLSLLLSTLLSVTPRISLFGSYQRLQGTYTYLAYLILFGAILANLRRRAQVDRLTTVLILTSLPVGLYGVLQRAGVDPLPWGGDTVSRVPSSMGNPIFLGAYLIMVLPVTFGRVVASVTGLARRTAGGAPGVLRAALYVIIAAIQLYTLWLTGSRGPWLGFLAGSFFFFVLLASYWGLRRLTVATVGIAAALGLFLVTLNFPNGPLESLRSRPGIGRLGRVFETEQATGLVRVLIWRGAVEMMSPHPPLEYPDGRRDVFNSIRPLVGYGPEAMLVAYNRFYPPELAQVERRTATPDRAHNETWDALATTGLFGLAAYLALFASVFYYGLKWLGLMRTPAQRNLFLALYAGGGAAGAAGLTLWRGAPFFGVGLPFGIMLGLIAYLTLLALSTPQAGAARPGEWRALLLISLIASVMAYFVEIHFGIAVAVSRTLFWLFAGLLVVVGLDLLQPDQPEAERRRKDEPRRRRPAQAGRAVPAAWPASAAILAALLCVLGYNFINNPYRLTSTGAVLWQALTTLPTAAGAPSYAVLLLFALTWSLGGLLLVVESSGAAPPAGWPGWVRGAGVVLGGALGVALVYWLSLANAHAGVAALPLVDEASLLQAVDRLNGLLTGLYLCLLLLGLLAAVFLPAANGAPQVPGRNAGRLWLALPLGLAALGAAYTTNLRVIQADTIYKTAEGFGSAGNWEVATRLYGLASATAPNEDYYFLYIGKGYLEMANRLTDAARQPGLVAEAEQQLLKARKLNPLNPDHTANLGRLYRWWASVTQTPSERAARAEAADAYYAQALSLSPNSALLWNEWASVRLGLLGDAAGALDRINRSLALDPAYSHTYALLGDYHAAQARAAADGPARAAEYASAAQAYQRALDLEPEALNPRLALGAVYSATGELRQAIVWYGSALQYAPPEANPVNIYRALADLHWRAGEMSEALQFAELALAAAPDAMKPEVQELVDRIRGN